MIQVLGRIPKSMHPAVLVGFDTADDAGVFRLDADRALVQTVDFFAPVVDDPAAYGAIAATNSISDIYAMGGQPLTALSIACFPDRQVDLDILSQIMMGGAEKLREAGVALLGGHTMCDNEIKFGYAVTGLIHPEKIVTNAGAQPGDALLLTKPLGLGIITTAIKRSLAKPETVRQAIQVMTTLNRVAAEVMLSFRSHAATDITGYGLLGHACEMAEASRTTFRFHADTIPYIPEAFELAEARILPGLVAKTRQLLDPKVRFNPTIGTPFRDILLDPQTSGGLLIAVHPDDRGPMLQAMADREIQAVCVGEVEAERDVRMIVA